MDPNTQSPQTPASPPASPPPPPPPMQPAPTTPAPPTPGPAQVAPAQPIMPTPPPASPITYEAPANARSSDETDYSNLIRIVGIVVLTAIVLWLAYALMVTVRPK